ncbi:ABC transporter ATP-binding protein [Eggerthella sp. NSJ-70]|uniref:ABC transporter ATP-binding protein n=2 Tax=Eggerthella hominis TaxID=2763043 RepID=A0ABR7BS41_9ACTN|nr:ABC transporter ATP-binding protein [Eggerthella hominis]
MRFGRKTPLGDRRKTVLDQVNLDVPAGRIVCLLGPSGCGKTTMVNLVMGILVPTAGTVRVLGEQAPYPTARRRIGFMPQDTALYEDVTAAENLRFFGTLNGLRAPELADAIDDMLAFTRLDSDRNRLVGAFSGGMKRRLSLGVAMLHRPDLLVLDEPTVGLDPEHRRRIWERFRELAAGGATLLVTTHIMDEALQCDDVAMLRAGRVIAQGTPSALLAQTGTANLEDAFLALAGNEREEASHA